MKQRITFEQINELTNEQKEWIREWWNPQEGDWVINHYGNEALFHVDRDTDWLMFGGYENVVKGDIDDVESINEVKLQCFPLLSISQMIECLQGLNKDWTLNGSSWDEPDICDRLWERLKYYL